MEKIKFVHKVSKGSRFNQIYIPKNMETYFQGGDLVEVTLIERKNPVHYSENLIKLSNFKEDLIKNIFLELKKYKEISQIFVVGSFLTQKQDFNDIDIILISRRNLEKEALKLLVDEFELKFHVISIPEDNFKNLQIFCPLTRSMLFYFVSNKAFKLPKESAVNKDHIRFLLMMPEDILKIKVRSRTFYESIRRLLAIEKFLKNLPLNPFEINKEIKKMLGEDVFSMLKQNEDMSDKIIKKLREIIKSKLKAVYNDLNYIQNKHQK